MRKIISALLKPGRKLRLDEPETRRDRKREEREAPITIPVSMSRTALRVFITLSIVVTTLAVIQAVTEYRDPAQPRLAAHYGAQFAITTLGNISKMAPGAVLLLPLLTYLASVAGGLAVGAFQVGYNFVDRVFGQKAMVEKATAEGKAEGIAEERERWMRKYGRDPEAQPDPDPEPDE